MGNGSIPPTDSGVASLRGRSSAIIPTRIDERSPVDDVMIFTEEDVARANQVALLDLFPNNEARQVYLMDTASDSSSMSPELRAALRQIEYGEDIPGSEALAEVRAEPIQEPAPVAQQETGRPAVDRTL
jgi:hypothetical protein